LSHGIVVDQRISMTRNDAASGDRIAFGREGEERIRSVPRIHDHVPLARIRQPACCNRISGNSLERI